MNRSAVFVMCLLTLAGCGGTTYVNKRYRKRLLASERLVIMPVEAHRLPSGMRSAIEAHMNRELWDAFGSRAVSVSKVKARLPGAGFGNLGWRLALGMWYRAKESGSPQLVGDYYDWLDEIPVEARKLLGWLRTAMPNAFVAAGGPRYILAGYVDRLETTRTRKGEPRLVLRVMVGIFDVQQGRTAAVTWQRLVCAPTLEGVIGRLRGLGAAARRRFGPLYR